MAKGFQPRTIASVTSDRPSAAPQFDFGRLAAVLAAMVLDVPKTEPFAVCIRGTWGVGKTTLLGAIAERLPDHVSSILFEPWKLRDEVEVRNVLTWKVLERIGSDADFASFAKISVDGRSAIRLVSERLLGLDPDRLLRTWSAESRTRDTYAEVENVFKAITRQYLERETDRRLLIIVDDLDRCRPDRIIEVLEATKLFFSLPGIVFLFGADQRQLERALQAQYGFDPGEAKTYLEKMFQLTFDIPHKDPSDLLNFLAEQFQSVGGTADDPLAQALIEQFEGNLRRLKLFVNNFGLQYRLFLAPASDGKASEIDAMTTHRADITSVIGKWLYLETVMPMTVDFALRKNYLEIFLAMEFFGFGTCLDDPELRQRYEARLAKGELRFLDTVAAAVIGDQADILLNDAERHVTEVIRSDGDFLRTLNVLGAFRSRLIDADIRSLARRTEVHAPVVSPPKAPPSDALPQEDKLGGGGGAWDKIGDALYSAKDHERAFFAYALAFIKSPEVSVHLTDVARALRGTGRLRGAMALVRRAVETWPDWGHGYVEIAYTEDIYRQNYEMGDLFYRYGHQLGSTLAGPISNLGNNLEKLGAPAIAVLDAKLAAYLISGKEEERRPALVKAIANTRLDLDVNDPDALERYADGRRGSADYALRPLSAAELSRVQELVQTYPSIAEAAAELNRPPGVRTV